MNTCENATCPLLEASLIPLTQGKYAIVDTEDYAGLSKHKWCTIKDKLGYYYAARNETYYKNGIRRQTTISMHRVIMRIESKEIVVDHINHNTLDNRKKKMRKCSKGENSLNRLPHKNGTSKYKGVSWDKDNKRWRALICFNGKQRHIGYFKCEKKAALAYNDKAKDIFGKFAYLNDV